MRVLALDLGSTQWKAAIVGEAGLSSCVHMPAPFVPEGNGFAAVDAEGFRARLMALICQLPEADRRCAQAVAITGMAEGGLLLGRAEEKPLTPVTPWYDTRSMPAFEALLRQGACAGRYAACGLPPSYKYGVFRILEWLRELHCAAAEVYWLGVVEYAAYCLSGARITVPSLAARTYAYNLARRDWDDAWLAALGIARDCLPRLDGQASLTPEAAQALGLTAGIPVRIAGHDHLCAAFSAGALERDAVFVSMGTAQTMIAQRPEGLVSQADTASGLCFGPGLEGGVQCVMGSIQSAGGSVAWAKNLLYPQDGYEAMIRETGALSGAPGAVTFFPYLSGSGAPHLNPAARGSFTGLAADTGRAQLALAVYEGIAMETRYVLARMMPDMPRRMVVSGGLCAHPRLLQAMADVCGFPVQVSSVPEGALHGAARLALRAAGLPSEAAAPGLSYHPSRHAGPYQARYTSVYLPLMETLYKEAIDAHH